jgi:hypothetical protein
MTWIIAIVALALVMTVLAAIELRQPVKANVMSLPDRFFTIATFAVVLIYGLTLLAAKIWA